MKHIYFARHGESVANQQHLFAGTWDSPLSEFGRAQARREAEQAKKLTIDLIVSSPLSRALETAQIIARGIGYPLEKILIAEQLRERCYGDLQQKPYSAADGVDLEKVNGVETSNQLLDRAVLTAQFLKEIPVDNILVVGHGTFGRMLRNKILKQDTPIEVALEDELPNAQVVQWV